MFLRVSGVPRALHWAVWSYSAAVWGLRGCTSAAEELAERRIVQRRVAGPCYSSTEWLSALLWRPLIPGIRGLSTDSARVRVWGVWGLGAGGGGSQRNRAWRPPRVHTHTHAPAPVHHKASQCDLRTGAQDSHQKAPPPSFCVGGGGRLLRAGPPPPPRVDT